MQFTVSRSNFFRELNLLQGVVEKKNTIPILTNILLETRDDGGLSLVATDLDVSLETQCPAETAEKGAVVLQARKIFDIVRNLPDGEIHFQKEENDWVRIVSGSSQFRLVGQAKEHFPSTPQAPGTGLTLKASLLNTLISRTVFAITQEESRYALSGALFVLAESGVQMVTTDGHRLALASCAAEAELDQLRVIIPKKALTELQRLTTGSDDLLEFSKDDNHLYFRVGHRKLTSRMLAGQFPNYDLVIPKQNDKHIKLNAENLAQAIRRAALMADERSHGVKFEVSDGSLNITSQTAEMGEARESIPVDYNEETVSIGFNATYLLDFLGSITSDEVFLDLKDDQSPALLRPCEAEGFDYKYVVMPMRLM